MQIFSLSKIRQALDLPSSRPPFNQSLSGLLNTWFEVNYWTPEHFSLITSGCCKPENILTAKEVEFMLDPQGGELKPKHFRALAAAYSYLKGLSSYSINSIAEIYALFSALPSTGDDASKPSWWFALYSGEGWADEQFKRFDTPATSIETLSLSLPSLIRKYISQTGSDPVSFVDERSGWLRNSFMPRCSLFFADWMLGYKQANNEEVRIYMSIAISILHDIGCDCTSICDLGDNVTIAKKPLALKPSSKVSDRGSPESRRNKLIGVASRESGASSSSIASIDD